MDSAYEKYKCDVARYGEKNISAWTRKYLFFFRKVNSKHGLLWQYYRFRYKQLCSRHGMEISRNAVIGRGLYIGHPYNITINEMAVLGENINIHKGVTIGQENRGKRKGTPNIGNKVWIGINATIVGNIRIGDDVLIAPNSFVNCDVPAHCVVLGNPCKIIPKENATEGYVNNCI